MTPAEYAAAYPAGMQPVLQERVALPETSASGVSWGAILAGAAGAAALAMLLLMLGVGLGLSSISPWAEQGVDARTVGVATIVWLSFTQLAASGMGGYLAGRLRTKWAGAHTDEVYFRDTAHGFLAWAIAMLVTAAMLTGAVGAIVGSGVQAGASLAGGAAGAATAAATGAGATALSSNDGGGNGMNGGSMGYFVDSLFRSAAGPSSPTAAAPAPQDGAAAPNAGTPAARPAPMPSAEVARIFANSLRTGALPADDVHYVGQLVAQRTGISQQDAEKRVTDTYAKAQAKLHDAETAARDAADKARKASAYATLWMFIALLIGAFVASLAATWGGRRRDL